MIGTLTRKALRRPDSFVTLIRNTGTELMGHTKGLVLLGVSVLVIAIAGILFMNHRQSVSTESRNALYLAEKTLETETQALLADQKADSAHASSKEDLTYQKLDVAKSFPLSLEKFAAVYEDFSGTRTRFDASVQLGDLFFSHGEYEKSKPWYQKASESGPTSLERSLATLALGYASENLGQFQEAITHFQKALNLGEGSLKGDLLLSVARCYEAIHDGEKARGAYDQIIADLPGSEWAKTAEQLRSRLP